MKELKFQHSEVDECLYTWNSKQTEMYLLLYVDDIIIAGNDYERIIKTKKKLMDQFHMKDLGNLHSFLGVNIHRTDNEIRLSQLNYLKKLQKNGLVWKNVDRLRYRWNTSWIYVKMQKLWTHQNHTENWSDV